MKVIQEIINTLTRRGVIDRISFLHLEKEGYCSQKEYEEQYGSLFPELCQEEGDHDGYHDNDHDNMTGEDIYTEMGAALDLIADLIRNQERPFVGAKDRKKNTFQKMRETNFKGLIKEIRRSSKKITKEAIEKSKVKRKAKR